MVLMERNASPFGDQRTLVQQPRGWAGKLHQQCVHGEQSEKQRQRKYISVVVVVADQAVRLLLRRILSRAGYGVMCSEAGTMTLDELLVQQEPHMLLLNDPEVCPHVRLRWSRLPILIIATETDEQQKVRALDQGADDYIVSPFHREELLARVRAHLRRARMQKESLSWAPDAEVLTSQDGTIRLQVAHHLVQVGQRQIHLTSIECALLHALMLHQGRVLTHEMLLQRVWGPAYGGEANYLRVYMYQLRKKVEPTPNEPRYLLTEARIGYVFQTPGEISS